MIIFKRKHLSIKWGIFAGLLVFLAILLLLLFLLQTVYLDDIYKAAKKNTLNNANDKVVQVLEEQLGNLSTIEQQLDQITAEYDIDIQVSGEDGTLLSSILILRKLTRLVSVTGWFFGRLPISLKQIKWISLNVSCYFFSKAASIFLCPFVKVLIKLFWKCILIHHRVGLHRKVC